MGSLAAGGTFKDASGAPAAQCLLTQRLACAQTGRELMVATFHFKAKGGETNDGIRRLQVTLHGRRPAFQLRPAAAAAAAAAATGRVHACHHLTRRPCIQRCALLMQLLKKI